MKKVISSILALVMVLAIVAAIPMTTSAAEVLNTSRYFAPDSTTKLDAFYGTPAIVSTTWRDASSRWMSSREMPASIISTITW